jgi:hypothetical protein
MGRLKQLTPPLTRRCPKCKLEKPLTGDFFTRNRTMPSGFGYCCLVCGAAAWSRRYHSDTFRYQEEGRVQRKQWRDTVLEHYGRQCACCGETIQEFLCVDHIGGGGNVHRKRLGNRNIYRWLVFNKFPPGFRLLCQNCNSAFAIYGHCPHHPPEVEVYDYPNLNNDILPTRSQ